MVDGRACCLFLQSMIMSEVATTAATTGHPTLQARHRAINPTGAIMVRKSSCCDELSRDACAIVCTGLPCLPALSCAVSVLNSCAPLACAGNDSGGECGVQISSRFVMPDVSDHGYWTHPRNTSSASSTSTSTSSANSNPRSSGSDRRNPTLGPDAAALLSAALNKQQHAGNSGPSARRLHVAGRAGGGGGSARAEPDAGLQADVALPRSNPPFWYSFSYGSVHFVVTSTEHDMRPGSKQYQVGTGLRYRFQQYHATACACHLALLLYSRCQSCFGLTAASAPAALAASPTAVQWLERDLRLVDRCSTPWVVLSMHRPMYVVFPHKSNRIVGDHLRCGLT